MATDRLHLKGFVAIWLTNGQRPIDAGNETRYDFFPGGWMDAVASATRLVNQGFLVWADGAVDEDDYHTTYEVLVTTKGVFEALS